MAFQFKSEIDISHFLTVITLIVALMSWLITTILTWHKKTEKDAKSGSLRLLLKIIRQQKGVPIELDQLRQLFQDQTLKVERKAYCGKNWKFKNKTQFEGAVYQLDWEGKIDFTSPDHIVFRMDRYRDNSMRFNPKSADIDIMLKTLENALKDPKLEPWELEKIEESCIRVDTTRTTELIRNALHNGDETNRRRIVSTVSRLVP